jgi:hypothetical protein
MASPALTRPALWALLDILFPNHQHLSRDRRSDKGSAGLLRIANSFHGLEAHHLRHYPLLAAVVFGPAVEQAVSQIAKRNVPPHSDAVAALDGDEEIADTYMFTHILRHANQVSTCVASVKNEI